MGHGLIYLRICSWQPPPKVPEGLLRISIAETIIFPTSSLPRARVYSSFSTISQLVDIVNCFAGKRSSARLQSTRDFLSGDASILRKGASTSTYYGSYGSSRVARKRPTRGNGSAERGNPRVAATRGSAPSPNPRARVGSPKSKSRPVERVGSGTGLARGEKVRNCS